MSSERDNPDNDKLVADTYRSLARERAPEHVNQKVLSMAASANRTRYSRTRAWIRPMAWAATIGLSLAIVLEITRLEQTEPDSVGITTTGRDLPDPGASPAEALQPAAGSPASGDGASPATTAAGRSVRTLEDDFVPQDMDVLREAEGMARTQAGPNQPPADARTDTLTNRDEIAPTTKRSPQTESQISAPVGAVATDAARTEIETAPDEVAPTERRSGQTASKRTAPVKAVAPEAARAASSFAAVAEPEITAAGAPCPDEVRGSARSWLTCIAELRELGRDDLAEIEFSEFRKIYPDLAEASTDR